MVAFGQLDGATARTDVDDEQVLPAVDVAHVVVPPIDPPNAPGERRLLAPRLGPHEESRTDFGR